MPLYEKYVGRSRDDFATLEDLQNIYMEVRNAAYEIIDRKKATYYGIGLALKRLVSCLLNDEKAILTVSTYQNGEYGREGYYIGVPAVVGNNGVEKIIRLSLNEMDQNKFNNSFTYSFSDILKGSSFSNNRNTRFCTNPYLITLNQFFTFNQTNINKSFTFQSVWCINSNFSRHI